jgi:hypothetical protein
MYELLLTIGQIVETKNIFNPNNNNNKFEE